MMDLDQIFNDFTDSVLQINRRQSELEKMVDGQLTLFSDLRQKLESDGSLEEHGKAINWLIARDPDTGAKNKAKRQQYSFDERMQKIDMDRYRFYGFCLAEAYEEFEDFLENILDFVTSERPELYTPEKIHKAKKDAPNGILNKIRETYPDFRNWETNNKFEIDFKLAVTTIAMLRHLIIHKKGVRESKEQFIDRVLKQAGYANGAHTNPDHSDFIESRFCFIGYENHISLPRIPDSEHGDIGIYHDLYSITCGHLVTTAQKIYRCVKNDSGTAQPISQ